MDNYNNLNDNTIQRDAIPADITPPAFAGIVSALNTGIGGEVVLSWDEATDHSGGIKYVVYWNNEGGAFSGWSTETTATSYTLPDLQNGVQYRFAVSAKDDYDNFDTNAKDIAATPMDTTAPQFAGLDSIQDEQDGRSITLHWDYGTDKYSVSYYIYQSKITLNTLYTIEIGATFTPGAMEIPAGAIVKWKNMDAVVHTIVGNG